MEISDLLRHQIIKRRTTQPTGKVADAAINLWEPMATQIISIIGEDGFNSLYGRSVFQTRITFSWLAAGALPSVTILMTSELEDRYTDLRFSPFGSAFLADAIIVQRYIEIAGQFKRVLSVVKVRGSKHSKDIRLFDITDEGIIIGENLSGYNGIMSGRPTVSQ